MRAARRKLLTRNHELTRFTHILQQHLPERRGRYNVTSLGLFGSYVRGDHRKCSDLDVLVEFTEAPSLFDFIELEQYLTGLLGIRVDLVMKSALKPRIGRCILSEVLSL